MMIAYAKLFILMVLTMLLVAACSSQPVTPTESTSAELKPVTLNQGQKLKVVATTTIVADIVKNVGGDKIDLTTLLPVGADPHEFEPTPADMSKLAGAQIIFVNGRGLEGFLTKIIENAGQAAIVEVSQGAPVRQMSATEIAAEGGHAQGEDDPHTWTTPTNVIIFVRNIEAALSALDPANAPTYQANAKTYTTQLNELDAWVKAQIETIPPGNRKLVTDHAIFGYYADRYGLKQEGAVIPSISTEAQPSAQELAALETAIKEQHIKAIFVGTTVNPTLSERVAGDTGVKLVTLYTGSLGPAGSGADTYINYIRYDTQAIVAALK